MINHLNWNLKCLYFNETISSRLLSLNVYLIICLPVVYLTSFKQRNSEISGKPLTGHLLMSVPLSFATQNQFTPTRFDWCIRHSRIVHPTFCCKHAHLSRKVTLLYTSPATCPCIWSKRPLSFSALAAVEKTSNPNENYFVIWRKSHSLWSFHTELKVTREVMSENTYKIFNYFMMIVLNKHSIGEN